MNTEPYRFVFTASGKEQALVEFYWQLRRDGMTAGELAQRARVGRTALTLIFNGRRCGRDTWKHVLPLLSATALYRLKQCSAWNRYAEAALAQSEVCHDCAGHGSNFGGGRSHRCKTCSGTGRRWIAFPTP